MLSRIMDEACLDEILMSQTVNDLSLGAALSFTGLDARPLRSVPGQWPLFSLS